MKNLYFNQLLKNHFVLILILLITPFILPTFAQKVEAMVVDDVDGINNSSQNKLRSIVSREYEPDALTFTGFSGENQNDSFGESVSTAGDVNGDGYEDIIIGIPYFDVNGTSNAGKVYIYFGGPSMDYYPDVTLLGENQDDLFGNNVSNVGDVNGDGFSDVLVGAPNYDYGGHTSNGKAYIFFGGEMMDNIPDVELYGEDQTDLFGLAGESAGDVNGDGISDIIIGAYRAAGDFGKAYLYFGSTTLSGTPSPDMEWTGESASDYFGKSVSSAGDVNGDGFSDIIIGADHDDDFATDAGAAYIFFGGTTIGSTYDIKLSGAEQSSWFGSSVSKAGDFNGDGFSDVIVGAYNYNGGSTPTKGSAYIYFGGSSMDVNADVVMEGESANNRFGYSVSGSGDINGDGFSDVIIGAPLWFVAPSQNQGRVYIYFGGISADDIPDIVLDRESEGPGYFGWSVSSGGDVDADGYNDILIGSPLAFVGPAPTGKAFLYKYSATGINIANLIYDDGIADNELGYCVSEAGDLNGDGFDDFVVGAPEYNSGTGIAYVFYGGTIVNNNPDITFFENNSGESFGFAAAGIGDINNDGYDDLLIGAPNSSNGGADAGAAYIYLGGASMDSIKDASIYGTNAGGLLGNAVAGAGDVNGDGYSDFIIGNEGLSSYDGGALIYYGGPSIDITPDVLLGIVDDNTHFGCSVSCAGDVNNDGFDDVIVGAYLGPEIELTGQAYIFYGGIDMDSWWDIALNGEEPGSHFGSSVSSAGDLNGDGFSDVVVGADSYGEFFNGRAYAFYGSLSMDSDPDLIFYSESSADEFGCSVDCAGDVNNDGYSDLLIGAKGNSEVARFAGKSYLYFGSSSMDNAVDVVMRGEASDDEFGTSVSTAGDYNNDGLDDIVVGAPGAVGSDGLVYLFLSSFPPVKPNLIFVKDVPFDQGGYVQLKWTRSGYDAPGISKITQYLIQRSFPPGETGFAWESIGSLPATHETFYSYVASTPNDSMTNNSGTFYFRITAITNNPEEYWRSNIMYGHSVDNLAPLPPGDFYAQQNGSQVHLGWQANTEPDLKHYEVYKSSENPPQDLVLVGITTDTVIIDTSPDMNYYYAAAVDIHNNRSDFAVENLFQSVNYIIMGYWNMLSLPLEVPDADYQTLFPNSVEGTLFRWNGVYSAADTMEIGSGYWLRFNEADLVNIAGIGVNTIEIELISGWNMIGGTNCSVPLAGVGDPGGIIIPGTLFEWSGTYATSETIEAGKGYWIRANEAGTITVDCQAERPLAKVETGELMNLDEFSRIEVEDKEGLTQTLYFGGKLEEGTGIESYSLPPVPPQGLFDVRLSGGYRLTESDEAAIEIQSDSYPLKVRIYGKGGEEYIVAQLTGEDKTEESGVMSGDELTITNNKVNKLHIKNGSLIPTRFVLYQNYPNPFNPTTAIKFAVAKESVVNLSIYSVLGELVTTLVNEQMKAGYYEYEFNASKYSSGVYLYRLQAGDPSTGSGQVYVETKKMVLMK